MAGPQACGVCAEKEGGASEPDAAASSTRAGSAASGNGHAEGAATTITAGPSGVETATSQASPTGPSPSPAEPVKPSIRAPADDTSQPAASPQGTAEYPFTSFSDTAIIITSAAHCNGAFLPLFCVDM